MADKNYPYIMPEYNPDDYPKEFSDLTAGDVGDDVVTGANIYGVIDYFRNLGKGPSLLSKIVKPSDASKLVARLNPVAAVALAAKDLYDIGKAGYTGYQMLQSQAEARKSQEDYEKALKESETRAVRKKSLRSSPVNLRPESGSNNYESSSSYPLIPSGLIKSPLPPNFGQQEQSMAKLEAMQQSNEQLKMDTYLAPDQQETFNSLIQNYDIPPIQLPKF